MIEYSISCGELAPGERLPSVRELADALNVAPMTVGQVYRDLRDSGLIETRPGLGTFVAETRGPRMRSPAQMADLQHRLDHLIDHALAIGLRPADIAAMMQARLGRRNARVRNRPIGRASCWERVCSYV